MSEPAAAGQPAGWRQPDRLPPPGPSFVRERLVPVGDRYLRLGMGRPSMAPDRWWLSVAWLADDEGVVPFRELAPAAGPPPDPPVARLGPALAGHLSGLIAEIDGRLGIRLAPLVPPADASRPWRSPAALRIALRLEPARAMTLRSNEIAEMVQDALGRALEGLRRP